jgi:hypothetical protein
MQAVTTIGLHIAKAVFQILGVDSVGSVIVRSDFASRVTPRSAWTMSSSRRRRLPIVPVRVPRRCRSG